MHNFYFRECCSILAASIVITFFFFFIEPYVKIDENSFDSWISLFIILEIFDLKCIFCLLNPNFFYLVNYFHVDGTLGIYPLIFSIYCVFHYLLFKIDILFFRLLRAVFLIENYSSTPWRLFCLICNSFFMSLLFAIIYSTLKSFWCLYFFLLSKHH